MEGTSGSRFARKEKRPCVSMTIAESSMEGSYLFADEGASVQAWRMMPEYGSTLDVAFVTRITDKY